MNILKDIPPGTAEEMNVIIEIPKGRQNKYEYDKKNKIFSLDRVLYSPFHYPAEYGFVPGTLCGDGDPLDGFVIMNEPTYPGILIKARPVAVVEMIDNGEQDNKLGCVAVDDPYHKHIKDVKDLSDHFLKSIKHFLDHYKDLQGKKVEVKGIKGVKEAKEEFARAVKRYKR